MFNEGLIGFGQLAPFFYFYEVGCCQFLQLRCVAHFEAYHFFNFAQRVFYRITNLPAVGRSDLSILRDALRNILKSGPPHPVVKSIPPIILDLLGIAIIYAILDDIIPSVLG